MTPLRNKPCPPTAERVQKRRKALRLAGLRSVQIWVPDTRRPGFKEECMRQSKLIASMQPQDEGLDQLMDEALLDIQDWKT